MNECKLHFYKTLESIGEVYMTELNIILVLLLLISTLVLHGKLNRIEKMLRQPGTDKNPLPVPPVHPAPEMSVSKTPPPLVIPQFTPPPPDAQGKSSPGLWEKFAHWFCYGIQRDDVSKEYAAATTWLIRAGILILLCAIGFFR